MVFELLEQLCMQDQFLLPGGLVDAGDGVELRAAGVRLIVQQALEPGAREPALHTGRFTCFYGHADNIVFPASTGTRPGADNCHLAGAAHVQMVFEPAPPAEVLRLLDDPAA